jgi:thiol-disulfide isomerase/thioredoxin
MSEEDSAAPEAGVADEAAPGTHGAPSGEHVETRRGLVGPFTARQLSAAVVVVVGVALLLILATRPIAQLPAATANPRPTQFAIGPVADGLLEGSVAPALTVTGPGASAEPLRDVNGNVVDLTALRGRPVWINFWASWCPPCQYETPILRSIFDRYRAGGLELISISVQESTADDVRAYAEKYGLGYTVAADLTGELFHRYKVYGLPTQFFIDGSGIVRSVVQGPVTEQTAAANLALIGAAPGSPASAGAPPASSPAASTVPATSPPHAAP